MSLNIEKAKVFKDVPRNEAETGETRASPMTFEEKGSLRWTECTKSRRAGGWDKAYIRIMSDLLVYFYAGNVCIHSESYMWAVLSGLRCLTVAAWRTAFINETIGECTPLISPCSLVLVACLRVIIIISIKSKMRVIGLEPFFKFFQRKNNKERRFKIRLIRRSFSQILNTMIFHKCF